MERYNRAVSPRPLLLAALLVLTGGSASADRLINIPTGKKLPFDEIRAEFVFGGHPAYDRGFLGMGVGLQFDAELIYERLSPNPGFVSFNFAYNYVTPVTDVSPGVSVGVRDAMNKTSDGRAFYLATTFRIATDIDAPAELTIGGGTQSLRGFFVGAMLPLTNRLRLLGEHDSLRWTAGLEVRPVQGLFLRALFRQDRTQLSVGYAVRF